MKSHIPAVLLLATVALTGCRHSGQGTGGPSDYETGTAHAEGSTPYALGRTRPFQRDGLANTTIAVSRPEAALDVSGSGTGELSRRSAAATIGSGNEEMGRAQERIRLRPRELTTSEILLDRVRLALSSTTPSDAASAPQLSIQTLNNLRLDVRDGTLTLRGRVTTPEEKEAIGTLVRGVEGVRNVDNQLELIAPERTR